VKGRKRHLLVDTQGLVLKAKVHAASVMDFEGIKMLLRRADLEFPRISHLWLDGGYTAACVLVDPRRYSRYETILQRSKVAGAGRG
jgi:transposase